MGKGSKPRPLSVSKEDFDNSFEGIFGKYVPPYLRNRTEENMQIRVKDKSENFGSCGCGRSPTGQCCGWHGLTEEQYREQKKIYDESLIEKKLQEPK